MPGSSSATGGPAVRPTSVVARKSRIALLHLSSAKSSEILNRSLPGPVSSDRHLQSLLLAFPLRAVLERQHLYLLFFVSPFLRLTYIDRGNGSTCTSLSDAIDVDLLWKSDSW